MALQKADVIIIGTGPAGLTAAIYVARSGLKPVVFTGMQPGGQLTTTTEVENFPGFPHGIMGPKLMEDMKAQGERFGTEFIADNVVSVDFSKWPLTVRSETQTFSAGSVIIATGATAKTMGLPREAELMGKGVSTCATCDGFFYKNKIVAVAGGGDTAMEEACYLAKLCKKVYLIHRRDQFRASEIMLKRAQSTPNIEFLIPYEVKGLVSNAMGLTGLEIYSTVEKQPKTLTVDGFFMAIGHKPNSDLFKDYLDIDDHGYIIRTEHCATKVPGVFAAGDIADTVFKQAVTAAGMGCQAGMQSVRFLEEKGDHAN